MYLIFDLWLDVSVRNFSAKVRYVHVFSFKISLSLLATIFFSTSLMMS